MKNRALSIFALVTILAIPAFATVNTTFDEGSLNPNVNLDIPNPSVASITLDTVNQELDFATTGSADMWTTRGDAPIAWTSRPAVALGDKWFVETEMRYPTDVLSQKARVAGIVFYGGPDGAGGQAAMDFSFGLNNWDDRFDPGYVAAVEVQGLGDNMPGDLPGNLNAPWTQPNVFLRVEVTELGAVDHYDFFYKANAGDAWTPLGSLNSAVDNSRASLFLKTSVLDPQDSGASFTYFKTGLVPNVTVPTFDPRVLGLIAVLLVAIGVIAQRA